MRLVKDGKIYLDGTLTEAEKEKIVFEQYEKLDLLLKKYNISDLKHLERIIIEQMGNEQNNKEYYEFVVRPMEKKAKALGIIREKKVDLAYLFNLWAQNAADEDVIYIYNYRCRFDYKLEKKEYALIKEVLS